MATVAGAILMQLAAGMFWIKSEIKEKMMVNRLKQYFWIGLALAAFYFLLTHHIIFTSYKEVDLLKKEEVTLEYTFYSLKNNKLIDVLRNDKLMDAGIEDVLLDRGLVTEERLDSLLRQINRIKKE